MSNGKNKRRKEVQDISESPSSTDPGGSHTECTRNNKRQDESRQKDRKSGCVADGLKGKPVQSDAAGMDDSRSKDDNLERNDSPLLLWNKERPGDGNESVKADRNEEFKEDDWVTLLKNTRERLEALSNSDSTHEAGSEKHANGDRGEDGDWSELGETRTKNGDSKVERQETKLTFSDAAAIVKLHHKNLGALPVNDNKAERTVNEAEVLIGDTIEAESTTQKETRDHDTHRVHHMVQEVTKRRACAKTTSMLAINSVHGLDEELSKSSKE